MNIVFLDEYSLGGIDLSRIKQLGNYTGYEKTTPGEIAERCIDADIVITNKVPLRAEAIKVLPQLKLICIAATGMNNVDLEAAAERGIEVRNAVGYSTHAVTETTIGAAIALLRQSIYYDRYVKSGEYAASDAPFHFGRPLHQLYGKRWGIIGLGAIGALVCNIALELGMDVYGYDPFLSVEAALRLDRHVHVVKNVDELYRVSDYITIHIPYNSNTRDFINAESISKMKGQVRILNLARGGLVNDDDMIQALESGRVARYVTDFPDEKIAVADHVVALPHLGASTPESEENCARMAADQLKDYLLNGNIKNSVNLPNVAQEWSGISRVCLIHQNIPAMLTRITSILSAEGVNVENLTNKSKKDYAYTMVDLNSRIKDKVAEELRAIPGMIRVRVLNH